MEHLPCVLSREQSDALVAHFAALAFGFERLGLLEIVSFTVPANQRSRAVSARGKPSTPGRCAKGGRELAPMGRWRTGGI